MRDFERTLKAFQTEMECSVSSRALYETYVYETYVMPYINEVARKHNLEIEHAKKAEYHRGYVDGTNQRKTETWQLDHDRAEVLARLVNSNLESGSAMRSLCFVLGVDWNSDNTTRSLGKMKARLAYLLGGAVEDSKLQKSPNFANADTIIELSDDYADLVAERDSILDLLKDAAKEYKELLDKYLSAPWETMQPMDDEHMNKLGWMRALDRDGKPICMGDVLQQVCVKRPFDVYRMSFRKGYEPNVGDKNSFMVKASMCTHVTKADPIEQAIKDLTIGSITEVEAIERIRGLVNG